MSEQVMNLQEIQIGKTKLRIKPAPVSGAKLKVRWDFKDEVEISDIMGVLGPEYQRKKNPDKYGTIGSYGNAQKTISSDYKYERIDEDYELRVEQSSHLNISGDKVFKVKRAEGFSGYVTLYKGERDHELGSVRFDSSGKDGKGDIIKSTLSFEGELNDETKDDIAKLEELRGKELKVTWCYGEKKEYEDTRCEGALG